MDPVAVSELLLNNVRTSGLNFQIQESPFSMKISLRKTFIKDRQGGHIKPGSDVFSIFHKISRKQLDKTNIKEEEEESELQKVIDELSDKLEKSKVEISDLCRGGKHHCKC